MAYQVIKDLTQKRQSRVNTVLFKIKTVYDSQMKRTGGQATVPTYTTIRHNGTQCTYKARNRQTIITVLFCVKKSKKLSDH